VGDNDWFKPIKKGEKELTIKYLVESEVVRTFYGHIHRHAPDITPQGGYSPPNQPMILIVETNSIPEPFVKDWVDVFTGSGGLQLGTMKIYEKFAYSESSSFHGAMLQKIQYQRNQAKDLLATIQSIKTAIVNIESDLEKLGEQIDAFKSGSWGQIKGLFIDNYGGPDRSWTAAARHVPIVRLALTWFLRLNPEKEVPLGEFFLIKVKNEEDRKKLESVKKKVKEACEENKKKMLEKVDQLIAEEKMNPALGNYLKRKIEEFWNWVANYSSWLKSTYERIQENLIQQKANLKMYMKWATDAIVNAESVTTNPEEFETGFFPGIMNKFTPSEGMVSEYIFHAGPGSNRPDIWESCNPYVPVLLNQILTFTSVEVQGYKITDVIFVLYHGYMHISDFDKIKNYLNTGKNNLIDTMIKAGALTEDEMNQLFTEEEINELRGEGKKTKQTLKEKAITLFENFIKGMDTSLNFFGLSLPNVGLPFIRSTRAASYAAKLAFDGIAMYKKGHGMLYIP